MTAGPGVRERGAVLLGRAAAEVVRRLQRGGGTALPGLLAGLLAPRLIESFAGQLGHGAVTVTGTNGKTTTAHLIAAAVRTAGLHPLANSSGSNLERGIASMFVEAATAGGALPDAADRLGVLELDEAVWPALLPRLRPDVAVFLNLFRDQLDRYGEVDSVAEGWRRALAAYRLPLTLALNVDDPSVAQIADGTADRVIGFGIDDPSAALARAEHAADARACLCGGAFRYDAVFMGHLGLWACSRCDRVRPTPQVTARNVRLGADETRFTLCVSPSVDATFAPSEGAGATPSDAPSGEQCIELTIPLAGLYSVYNALAAVAGALALGIPLDATVRALTDAGPAFGRQEQFDIDGRTVRLLLAKNPTGLNEVFRVLTAAPRPLVLLALLNDGIQDGQDVSWIYDADMEQLAGSGCTLIVSGDRADDLALRFMLAGVVPTQVERSAARALDVALAATPSGGRLEVVATYTAMLAVRADLARRTGAQQYWEQSQPVDATVSR